MLPWCICTHLSSSRSGMLTCCICRAKFCLSSLIFFSVEFKVWISTLLAFNASSSWRFACFSTFNSLRNSLTLPWIAWCASCSSSKAFSFSANCFFSLTMGSWRLPYKHKFDCYKVWGNEMTQWYWIRWCSNEWVWNQILGPKNLNNFSTVKWRKFWSTT